MSYFAYDTCIRCGRQWSPADERKEKRWWCVHDDKVSRWLCYRCVDTLWRQARLARIGAAEVTVDEALQTQEFKDDILWELSLHCKSYATESMHVD